MANVESVLARLKAAADLTERAVSDVLDIASALQEAVQALPDSQGKAVCLDHVSKLFETCTFEDLAKQHLEKVMSWVKNISSDADGNMVLAETEENPLLRGPALDGEESVQQSIVDNMLKKD